MNAFSPRRAMRKPLIVPSRTPHAMPMKIPAGSGTPYLEMADAAATELTPAIAATERSKKPAMSGGSMARAMTPTTAPLISTFLRLAALRNSEPIWPSRAKYRTIAANTSTRPTRSMTWIDLDMAGGPIVVVYRPHHQCGAALRAAQGGGDSAGTEHDHPIGRVREFFRVRRDEQDSRTPLCRLTDQFMDLGPG